jgi:hypothetical protein
VFTQIRHWTLSWASWTLFAPSIPISLRSILFQVPNLMSFFHWLGRAKESVQVWGALKHFVTIKNFYGEGFSAPRTTPQAGGPLLVSCPRLHIQYIRSYRPYPEDFPPSATWGRTMPWLQGTHLIWCIETINILIHTKFVWHNCKSGESDSYLMEIVHRCWLNIV